MSVDILNSKKFDLPENTDYSVKTLVGETPIADQHLSDKFQETLSESGIGKITVHTVHNLQEDDLRESPDPRKLKRALKYSGSIIADTGSIGNLIDDVKQEDQEFSALETFAALVEAGLVPEDFCKVLKIGTSGVVLEDGRGGEVVETLLLALDKDRKAIIHTLTKVASSDSDKKLKLTKHTDPKRVLLENEFIVMEQARENSNAILIRISPEKNDVNLYELIAKAAKEAGIEHFTIRATIHGPLKAKMAVIKDLPGKRIEDISGIKEILIPFDQEQGEKGVFHFVGSLSTAESRVHQRWGDITGNPIYSPKGHYHGYSEDSSMGGHVLALFPQKGSTIEIILEPAKVVQIEKN